MKRKRAGPAPPILGPRTVQVVGETLRWARDELGLTYPQLSALLKAPERTVRAWRKGKLVPGLEQRVVIDDLFELQHVLADVFPDPGEQREWLSSPCKLLDARKPISLVLRGRIARVVEALAALGIDDSPDIVMRV